MSIPPDGLHSGLQSCGSRDQCILHALIGLPKYPHHCMLFSPHQLFPISVVKSLDFWMAVLHYCWLLLLKQGFTPSWYIVQYSSHTRKHTM